MTDHAAFTEAQCIAWRLTDGALVIRVRPVPGSRVESYELLHGEIVEALQRAPRSKVIINLSEVTDLSSQMLGILAALYRRVSSPGGIVAVCGLSPESERILRLTRMDTLLKVCRDEAAAQQA